MGHIWLPLTVYMKERYVAKLICRVVCDFIITIGIDKIAVVAFIANFKRRFLRHGNPTGLD